MTQIAQPDIGDADVGHQTPYPAIGDATSWNDFFYFSTLLS